ncbi:MAG: hypothetical protein LIO80_03300 [Lachnospiraceae bacterium]|nr:hypothetical protein [Lachnospiraceae bacterium]
MAGSTNRENPMYIEGNTVHRQQAAPNRRGTVPNRQEAAPNRRQTAPRRQPVLPEKTREEIIRDRERRLSAKRNRERTMTINLSYVLFLTVVTAICFCACIVFVHLQSDITTHMSAITALETQISDLKSENEAAENRLESGMTLAEVKQRAAELGLVYPSSSQIQYYSIESNDYMNQYSDVNSD